MGDKNTKKPKRPRSANQDLFGLGMADCNPEDHPTAPEPGESETPEQARAMARVKANSPEEPNTSEHKKITWFLGDEELDLSGRPSNVAETGQEEASPLINSSELTAKGGAKKDDKNQKGGRQ